MNNVVKPESIDEKDHIPTFDVEYAINFAYNYAKKGLSEDLKTLWKQSISELHVDIELQLKRQDFLNRCLKL